jgi:hypothetical protein
MDHAPILKQNPEAWDEGFKAGEDQKRRCPYPAGSTEAWSWHSGQVEGDAKRQGFSYSRGTLPKETPGTWPRPRR